MATEALKSVSITNQDALPIVANTIGEGAPGSMRIANDRALTTAGVTIGSTYKLVRIPTNAKVKQVLLNCAAHGGAMASDFSIAHSDSTTDGTPPSLQGNIVQIAAADNKLFGSAVTLVSALKNSDITFQNTFTTTMQNLPLWQALVNLGATTFTADPGGFFDIVAKSTATDTSGGDLSVTVVYVE